MPGDDFITRVYNDKGEYEIIFHTDDWKKYSCMEHFCRQLIGHLKPGEERYVLKRKKRPKCPNGYRCGDCVHADGVWEDLKFRGIRCRIDAR